MKVCVIEDCNDRYEGRGFCHKHYERWRIHGDPNFTKHRTHCIIENCNDTHRANGLCVKHNGRLKKYGDPYFTQHKLYCIIENCEDKHYAKDLCRYHYNKNYAILHPEMHLKSNKKHLVKLGKIFDMNSSEYLYAIQSWSITIKQLDNNICRNCGSKENLNAHHIQPKAEFPKLALNIDNGITLCKICHESTHGFIIYN